MTPKKLAAFYLKFWDQDPKRSWVLADNAPTDLWKFLLTQPNNREFVHEALSVIATGGQPEVPDTATLLARAATLPRIVEACDGLLGSRQPPKTLTTLLRQAYLAEIGVVAASVKTFLQAQLDKP